MRISIRQIIAATAIAGLAGFTALAQSEAKDLYLNKCSVCHGPDGAGKTARGKKLKVQDVRETSKKLSADDMIKIVQDGKGSNMDAYGKELSKEQIKQLVEYYRSLAKQ